MPKFEKLRVSLARSALPPLLEAVDQPDIHLPRTEFLKRAFAEARTFLRGDNVFTFHPIETPIGFAAGFFAREHSVSLRHHNLEKYVAENYEPALFMLSLDKAQVIWMEDRSSVGSPKAIIEAFFDSLNKKAELKDWNAFIRYFEDETGYWDAVRAHSHEITKVIFRFVPPNAFEGAEWAQRFYTEIQKEAGNEILEETFKGKPGQMRLDGPMMTASAEIAEKGAGERELRGLKNRSLYNSADGRVSEIVPEPDMPTIEHPSFLRRVLNQLFRNDGAHEG